MISHPIRRGAYMDNISTSTPQWVKLSIDNVKDLSDSMQVNYCYFMVSVARGVFDILLLNFSQKLTDDYIKKIDVMFKQKEKVSLSCLLEYSFDLNESLLYSNKCTF